MSSGGNNLIISKDLDVIPVVPVEVCVPSENADNGTDIVFKGVDNSSDALFKFICNKDGTYSILTHSSDYNSCFDVYESSKENGANVCQWEYNGGANQKFIIEPADTTVRMLPGDVDSDGDVNMGDLIILHRYLLGRKTYIRDLKAADVNEDGKINVFDSILLKRIIINGE